MAHSGYISYLSLIGIWKSAFPQPPRKTQKGTWKQITGFLSQCKKENSHPKQVPPKGSTPNTPKKGTNSTHGGIPNQQALFPTPKNKEHRQTTRKRKPPPSKTSTTMKKKLFAVASSCLLKLLLWLGRLVVLRFPQPKVPAAQGVLECVCQVFLRGLLVEDSKWDQFYKSN